MKQYKTLLFDMDGTVDDTDPLVLEAMLDFIILSKGYSFYLLY